MSIIVAPHCDDECVSSSEVLKNETGVGVVYVMPVAPPMRKDRAKLLPKFVPSVNRQWFYEEVAHLFNYSYYNFLSDLAVDLDETFYFPDPYFETHPDHRAIGNVGEQLLRSGVDVVFYSVNMRAPYIHEVDDPEWKRDLLDNVYPDQNKLWKYDHRYWLFEGKCVWLME